MLTQRFERLNALASLRAASKYMAIMDAPRILEAVGKSRITPA